MSRVGKLPVVVPSEVQCVVNGRDVSVSGKLGKLSYILPSEVSVVFENGELKVIPESKEKRARAMWGLARSLLNNMVTGVSKGFQKKLEIVGVGYKAAVDGNFIVLSLGHSHDIMYQIPEGVKVVAEKPTTLLISGSDKQKVGEVAAMIVKQRPPEPYKGKGVSDGRPIRRKEGKKK